MATYRHVEVVYLDSPPMLASIDSRTPNKVNGHGNIEDLEKRGYTITRLLLATPERIAALEFSIELLDYEASWRLSNDSKFPNAKLVDEGNVLRQMLAEMKGEAHHAE